MFCYETDESAWAGLGKLSIAWKAKRQDSTVCNSVDYIKNKLLAQI